MLRPSLVAVAVALGLLGACGSPTEVDTVALRAQLSGLADRMDACVARTRDARRCTDSRALGSLPEGTRLGDGEGEIAIEAPRPLAYRLHSKAGEVRFEVTAAPVGARRRSCAPAGRGDCTNSGAW